MRSLSYFAKDKIDFNDIERCARTNGYGASEIMTIEVELLIEYAADGYWRWIKARKADFYEEEQQSKLTELNPQSMFLIEYHSSSAVQLIAFLECLIKQHGGWVVGNSWDDGLYTADNLKLLPL